MRLKVGMDVYTTFDFFLVAEFCSLFAFCARNPKPLINFCWGDQCAGSFENNLSTKAVSRGRAREKPQFN